MLTKQWSIAIAVVCLSTSISLAVAWASMPKPQPAVARYSFQYMPFGPQGALYFVTDNAENKVFLYHNDAVEGNNLKGVYDLTTAGQPKLDYQPVKTAEVTPTE